MLYRFACQNRAAVLSGVTGNMLGSEVQRASGVPAAYEAVEFNSLIDLNRAGHEQILLSVAVPDLDP